MAKRIILQVDGGGILGITPALVLHELEQRLRVKKQNNSFLIRDMLTLCCGTSTGAIMAGFVVAGLMRQTSISFILSMVSTFLTIAKIQFTPAFSNQNSNGSPFSINLPKYCRTIPPTRMPM